MKTGTVARDNSITHLIVSLVIAAAVSGFYLLSAPAPTEAVSPLPATSFAGAAGTGDNSLKATFTLTLNVCSGTLFSFIYGDGSHEDVNVAALASTTPNCRRSVSRTHTYASAGTYTATLNPRGAGAWEIQRATVQVSNPPAGVSAGLTASPTSGDAPLTVTFTGRSDRGCGTTGNFHLNYGDGSTESFQTSDACKSSFTKTHTYTDEGTYKVSLRHSSLDSVYREYEAVINVDNDDYDRDPTNADLDIYPSSGDAPLSVEATFKLGNTCEGYRIDWDDGSVTERDSDSSDCRSSVTTITRNHTYYDEGRYNIRLRTDNGTVTHSVTVDDDDDDEDRVEVSSLRDRIERLVDTLSRTNINKMSTRERNDVTAEVRSILDGLIRQLQDGSSGQSLPGFCPSLGRTLSRGSSSNGIGGDVSQLQMFLARDRSIYPEGEVTGYFGRATEQAVQRFQARYGVASYGTSATTGYGMVGARTQQMIAQVCR